MKKCKCCNNGKKKQQRCWSCAGFSKAPSKAELVAHTIFDAKAGTKEHFEQLCLNRCQVCKGMGYDGGIDIMKNNLARANILVEKYGFCSEHSSWSDENPPIPGQVNYSHHAFDNYYHPKNKCFWCGITAPIEHNLTSTKAI